MANISEAENQKLFEEADRLLKKARLQLRKQASNSVDHNEKNDQNCGTYLKSNTDDASLSNISPNRDRISIAGLVKKRRLTKR